MKKVGFRHKQLEGGNVQMIEWKDKFSVGITIIDEEHKKFIGILNKAIFAKEHSDHKKELMEVIKEMTK